MKTLCFFAVSFLLLNSGCKTSSGPGTNDNNSSSTLAPGAAYFPLSDNTLWTAHITGSNESLDRDGNVTNSESTDADYKAALGTRTLRGGLYVLPLFTYDQYGRQTDGGAALGYGLNSDSEAYGFNNRSDDAGNAATILPRNLSVGMTWSPAPESAPIECQATLVQHLTNFANKGGTTYNDVIQVHVTYLDSISSQSNKFSANVDLYFANAVGLVEADVHSFDVLYGDPYDFKHSVGSGTVYRKN